MQKWEYLFVETNQESGKPPKPRNVNDQELRDWKRGPAMSQYANQLGEQGWEFVGFFTILGFSNAPNHNSSEFAQ